MAPTETLAEQHFLTVEGICAELGVGCVLLTSSLPAAAARDARARLETGEAAARRWHARADSGSGRVSRARSCRRRRAAPFRG